MATDVRFYADEQIPKAVVTALRSRGLDVVTVVDVGLRTASDERHLAFAYEERRVVITQDEDFLTLAAAGSVHAGIAYAPQGATIGRMVRGLVPIHAVLSTDDMIGTIEFI